MSDISKHIKVLCLFLLLWMAFPDLSYSQRITIAVEDDAAPWSQKDGTGYANDIVKAAFTAVNQNIKLEVVPYSRAKEMVISGKVPACFSMAPSNDLNKVVLFPKKPLFSVNVDYFTKKDNKAKSVNDFKKGTVVGVVTGYEYPSSIYELEKKGIIILDKSESEISNLKKLALGRVDYALIVYNPTKPAELLMAKAGVNQKVKRAFKCGNQNSYIGFSSKNPQGKSDLKKFNKGFDIISKNGILNKIDEKWKMQAQKQIKNLNSQKK